jgi:hypothetical protein
MSAAHDPFGLTTPGPAPRAPDIDVARGEHDRLVRLTYAKAAIAAEQGRARDADRWRAFAAWLRGQAPQA